MKRSYQSPKMRWVPIRSSKAVAEVCWAHANNSQPFYYNTYGFGYAELYAVGRKCDDSVTFEIKYVPETMTPEQRAAADADMQAVLARVMATVTQSARSYKGSVFSPDVDPSWS